MNDLMCTVSVKAADWLGHPVAIILFPILCIAWLVTLGQVNTLTLVLSILAISTTQLILQAQNLETKTNKLQMRELLLAIPNASDEVAYADKMSKTEVEEKL